MFLIFIIVWLLMILFGEVLRNGWVLDMINFDLWIVSLVFFLNLLMIFDLVLMFFFIVFVGAWLLYINILDMVFVGLVVGLIKYLLYFEIVILGVRILY